MTIEHPEPGSKPQDDRLRAICAAARRVECIVCLALAGEECVYTTGPVSVPVTAETPLRPVRGYHVARFDRAADLGLITGADAEEAAAGLAAGAVVWDNGDAPREPGGEHAMATPHPYIPPGPVETAPYLGYCQLETRQAAFAAVLQGVPTGAYDAQIINWLAGWDDPTCRTIASLMWRCRLAGAAQLAARLDGLRQLLTAVLADEHRSRQLALEHAEAELADICTAGLVPAGSVTVSPAEAAVIRQALADASAWRTWRPEGDRAADAELATAYEAVLRRLVTGQEVL